MDDPSFRRAGKPTRSLMARAVDLLSRREHSRFELARKLRRHLGPDEGQGDIDRVLDHLQAQQLLSDERFARSRVRQRASREGDAKLARDLRERGVSEGEVDAAIATLTEPEAVRALATWARRFDALPTTAAERGRQGRFLQARGFSMHVITRVLAGKVEHDDE